MSADAAPGCPVCQWPAQGESAACHNCGWRLLGGYVVGAPPPQAQRELDDAIARGRRRYALRVAVRAASWRGMGNLAWLASLSQRAVGGAPVSEGEIEDAVAAYHKEEVARPAATGVNFTLSRLVAGDTDAIEFVEISPQGVSVHALVADELGVPKPRAGGHVYWTDVPAELPVDDDLRMYLLAGGVGDPASVTAPAALAAWVAAAAGREVGKLAQALTEDLRRDRSAGGGHDVGTARPPLAPPDTVLVRRTQWWPSLEAAATRARAVVRPVAEIFAPGIGPLAAIVQETIRRAPLRYDYCLVLAAIDQRTGRVRPVPRPLFSAGTTGYQPAFPPVNTSVMAPSGAADRLVLPVVARRGDDPAGWPAVGGGVMDGAAPGLTHLRVRLEAPGWVSMSATPRLVRGDVGPGEEVLGWPGLLAGLPDQLPGAVVANVVLLAELGGQQEMIAKRMTVLHSVVDGLDSPRIKVAVIGYREHWDKYGEGNQDIDRRLLVGCGLRDAADVRTVLAQPDLWQPVEIRDLHAAPLEDAIGKIAQPGWDWRPGARHVLVVFASRPPHPGRVDDRGELLATTCARYSWPDTLGQLRGEQAVECMAVLPEREGRSPASNYAAQAWAEFGAAGVFYVERSPAADLLHTIGIGKTDDGVRLPLAVSAPDVRAQGGLGEGR